MSAGSNWIIECSCVDMDQFMSMQWRQALLKANKHDSPLTRVHGVKSATVQGIPAAGQAWFYEHADGTAQLYKCSGVMSDD